MITIEWTGPDRVIPGHGLAESGQEKTLPDEVAESYIGQGLARLVGAEGADPKVVQMKPGQGSGRRSRSRGKTTAEPASEPASEGDDQ